MPVDTHYRALSANSLQAFEQLAADNPTFSEFIRTHNFSSEFELLRTAIDSRPEAELFAFGLREYQFALYAASMSMYRHASLSLRLFLELSLAAIHFSAHEIRLRKWQNETGDIIWATLIDGNERVFAKNFILAFNPGMENLGKQYSTIAEKAYRECSEFVHGNSHTHASATRPLGFDKALLQSWMERADAIRLSIIFAFAARYLRLLPDDARGGLETLMLDNLGHVPTIRDIFGK